MGSWSPSAQSKIGVKAPTAPATAGAVGQRDGAPGGHRPAPMHMPQPGDPPILEAPYPDQEPFEAEATTTPLPPPLPPPSPAKSQPTAPKAKAPAAPVASAPAPDYLTPEEAEEEMLQQDADVAARNAAALRDVTPLEGRVIPWQSIATSLDDAVETGLSDGTFKTGIDASPEALKAKETRAKPTSLLDKARTYVPVLDIISPLPEDASPERKVAGLPEVAAHAEKSTDDAVKSASPLLQSFAAIPATTSGIPSPTLAVLSALTGVKPAEDRPQNALKAVAASSADETVRRGAVVDATLDEWARKLGTTRQALEAEADLRGIPWGEAVARAKKGDKAHEALNAAVKERGVNLANPARMSRPENIKIDDLNFAPTYRKGDESAGIMYSPEDDDLVVRPGELGYDAAMALIHASEEGGVDPYWVSAIQASTDPFKKYMLERTPDLTSMILEKRGVPEEKRNPGSIEYDEAQEQAWQRALSELVARKTVGLWAPPIFLDVEPGDVFGGVDVEGPGGAMIRYGEDKQKSFIADAARAGLPQVEVVGFGAATDPNHPTIVTRVRSPAATVFDVLDVPIYAATGAAEHYFDKNRSYFPGASEEQKAEIDRQREQAAQTSYGEAMTSSIRARHDSVQGMMESDFAKPRYLYDSRGNLLKDEQGVPLETETWRPAVAAMLGLGGAVVSPDMLMGVAGASKLGKMAGRGYSTVRDAMEVRGAARMLSEMTTARAAGQTLMREALEAEKVGNGVLAAEKQGEALKQFKRASDLEGRARSETPALARQLDIADATQAHRAAEANPDVLDAALTSYLDPASHGESGVAQAQLNVHPSQRRVNLGVDTKQLEAHYADYQDLFSPDQQIQRIDAAARRVEGNPELQRRLRGKLFESAAEPHLASLVKLAGEDEATAAALKTGIRTLGSSLGDAKAEKAAHQALLDARSMSPVLDAAKAKDAADAARRQKLRHEFILGVNDLVREARTLPDPVEVAKETRRRAIEAVLANSESRAIAAGTLSDALHRRAGNPNLGELTQGDPTLLAHERFAGAPSLSPRARRVADDLVAAGVKKEIAEGSAMLLDVRARVAATRKGTTADAEFGRLVRAAKDEHGSYRAWAAGEPGGEVLYAAARRPLTETPEFKAWFRDSKVVDADGKPLVVYHGTNKDFEVFETTRPGSAVGSHFGSKNQANYIVEDLAGVGERQSPLSVMPVYLRIENPMMLQDGANDAIGLMNRIFGAKKDDDLGVRALHDISGTEEGRKLIEEWESGAFDAYDLRVTDIDSVLDEPVELKDRVIKAIKEAGYDGISYINGSERKAGQPLERAYVVFDPEQVKSVNNSGAFDPRDPRILHTARGPLRGDADLAGAVVSWRTGSDAASYLATHAADEVHRIIAERIAPYVADVEVVQQPQLGYGMKTLESAGAYYPDANVLRLTPEADQQVVLHELMHAATANKLRAAPDSAEARKIDRLYQRAIDEAEKAGETAHYGLENRDEFIAEAFSNPDFQRFLRTVLVSPSKPETLWSSFVASVRSLLGLQGRGSTLLDETWQAVDDLLKAKSAGPAVPDLGKIGVAEGFFSPLQDAISEVFRKTGARKMSSEALLRDVRKLPGVKDDEVAWSGIESFLAGKEKVSAAEIEGWLRSREPVVEVRGLGPTGEAAEELKKAATEKANADAALSVAREEARALGIEPGYSSTTATAVRLAQDVLNGTPVPPQYSRTMRDLVREIVEKGQERIDQIIEADKKWEQANDRAIEATRAYDKFSDRVGTRFSSYIAPGPSSNYREIRFLQNDIPLSEAVNKAQKKFDDELRNIEQYGLAHHAQTDSDHFLYDLLDPDYEEDVSTTSVDRWVRAYGEGHDEAQMRRNLEDLVRAKHEMLEAKKKASQFGPGGSVYQHFEPNTLAHLRVSDRVDDQGRKILFVEEAQSDWHQAGAKKGYELPPEEQARLEDAAQERLNTASAERIAAFDAYDKALMADADYREAAVAHSQGSISDREYRRILDATSDKIAVADPALVERLKAAQTERDSAESTLIELQDARMNRSKPRVASHSDLWRELALKQAISLAAREGYDGVALTKADIIQGVVGGEEEGQAVFYNEMLPKTLDRLAGKDAQVGSTRLDLVDGAHKNQDIRQLAETEARLQEALDNRSEIERIFADDPTALARAHKGYKTLEDKISRLKAAIQPREVPFLPITPALRDRVLNRGLPLYAPAKKAAQDAEKAGASSLPASDLEAAERRLNAARIDATRTKTALGQLVTRGVAPDKIAAARERAAKADALLKGYASEYGRLLREAKRVEKTELEAGIRVLEEDPVANADIIRAARNRLAELAGRRGAIEAPISSPVLAQVEEATARIEKKAAPTKDLKALRVASSAASSEVYAKAKEIERIEARLKALRESPRSKDNVAHFNRVGAELAQARREKKALVGQAAVARRELHEAEAAVQEAPTQAVRVGSEKPVSAEGTVKVSKPEPGTAKMSRSVGSEETPATSRPVEAIRTNLRDVQERLRRALHGEGPDDVAALHVEQDKLLKELHEAEGMPEDEVEAVAAAETPAPAAPAAQTRAPAASSGPAMLPEVTETRQVGAAPAPAAPPASPPPVPPASAVPPTPATPAAGGGAGSASRPFAVLFHDGEATLAAVRDSQNPRDLIHAIGHVIRRDLDADELEALNKVFEQEKIPARLTSEGKWVSPAGAGLSSAEIQGAEDVFADMLVNYVEHNTAPPGTSRSLNLLKEELKVVAASTQGAAESPAVAAFFDRLLGFEPDPAARKRASQAAADPRAFKASFWQRYVTGHPGTQASHGVFAELAKAAQQAGIDTDASRLQKQLERNGRIDFPVNVLGHGSYDADKIADMQKELGRIWAGSRDERVGRVPKRATIEGQPEQDLSEKLWSHAETPAATKAGNAAKAVERWALTPVLGQDAYRDLRKLPAPVRDDILVAQRKVESAYADALRLVSERRDSDLADFLLGKNVTTEHGRPLFSSGRSKAGPIRDLLSTYIADSKPNTQAALGFLGKYAGRIDELGEEERELAAIATAEFLYGDRAPLFNKQLTEVVGAPSAATTPGKVADARPQEMKLTGALVKFATAADPRDGLTALTTTLREQYGAEAAAQVAVLLSGHGAAAELPTVWKELGLAVSREDALLYKKWILGERIPEEKLGDIRRIARRVGLDAEFVETAILGDLARTPGMVPKEALDRALKVLSKSTPEKPHFLSSTDEIRDSAKAPDYAKGLATFISYNKAQKTRGVLLMRKMFTFTNTLDSVFNSAWSAGLLPSLMSSLRLTPHTMMVMTPALSRVIYHLEQANLLDKGTLEAVKDSLGKIGDVGAHAVATMSGRGGLRLDVSDILLGSDKVHIYGEGTRAVAHRASDLRTIAAEEGVFSTFPREIEKVFRHAAEGPHGTTGWAREWAAMAEEYVEDMTESWAERERLGLMVSLMELGYEPRQAARLTVTTLFDYGTSVTHAERSWIMGIFKPFWGYEKNIQRFTVNSLLRPTWAVRANAIRRATEYGPDAISDVLYAYSTDPYGIDPGALSPEARDSYYALRSEMESRYGGYEHMPKDVRQAITDLFHDTRGWQIRNGKLYEQNAALTPVVESANGQDYRFEPFSKERDSRGNLIPQHANLDISGAVVPKRDSSARSSIYRDRGGIVIPPYLDEATKKYLALAEAETGSRPYAEFYLPESGIEAGTRGVTAILATYANLMLKMVDALAQDPSSSLDALPVGAPMQYFMNPEMTMLLPEISDALFDSHLSMPARVSPQTAAAFRWAGWTVQEVNGAQDPYAIAAEHGEAPGSPDHAGNEAPAAPDFVDPAMQQRFKDTRYYLMPGRASLMWAYTGAPLDKLILKGERSPLERAQDGPGFDRADLEQALRVMIELPSQEVNRTQTAKREEPRFESTTTTPGGRMDEAGGL